MSKYTSVDEVLMIRRPSPKDIDTLAFQLGAMGVKVPPRDTAFFQAAVRQWLDQLIKPT